ncbi:hypothetical protein NIES4103_21900 [Nostoc sp. NIES-4103]|nr:hypothetical protein NIES4103_21900 [Nostoc sp. NIES-4103]
MPEHSQKINLPWTEEHEAFCYQHHIPPAAKSLWQWLMRQGYIGTEIEPDLSEFNATVAKSRGKGYSHNYLKQMFELLLNHRVVQVVKQYSWKIYKLLVRPLDWLKPQREKNLQNSNSSYRTQPSNDSNAVEESIQQQHSTNKQLLEDNGIYYDDNVTQVLHRPTNEIRLAIIMFNLRGGFEKIENPEGFIRDCLRFRWWEYSRNYNHLLQLYGNSTEWDDLFPSG